jgi:hypothetical protein
MRLLLTALAVLGTGAIEAAQSSDPPSAQTIRLEDEALDEVVVTGLGPAGNRDQIVLWLRQLPGRYNIEGTLSQVRDIPVKGASECVAVGAGPGVRCVIVLDAPLIDTHLKPGAYMLGIHVEQPLMHYMTVDDTGAAAVDTAELHGDTAMFRTACRAGSARRCMATTRITARPGLDKIRLRVEVRMDGRVTMSYDVTQTRVK